MAVNWLLLHTEKSIWGKSYELLPLLANHNLSLLTRVYSTCARSVMFHAAETWAMTMTTYHRDSRQEFEKVGGVFPILHMLFLLDASN